LKEKAEAVGWKRITHYLVDEVRAQVIEKDRVKPIL